MKRKRKENGVPKMVNDISLVDTQSKSFGFESETDSNDALHYEVTYDNGHESGDTGSVDTLGKTMEEGANVFREMADGLASFIAVEKKRLLYELTMPKETDAVVMPFTWPDNDTVEEQAVDLSPIDFSNIKTIKITKTVWDPDSSYIYPCFDSNPFDMKQKYGDVQAEELYCGIVKDNPKEALSTLFGALFGLIEFANTNAVMGKSNYDVPKDINVYKTSIGQTICFEGCGNGKRMKITVTLGMSDNNEVEETDEFQINETIEPVEFTPLTPEEMQPIIKYEYQGVICDGKGREMTTIVGNTESEVYGTLSENLKKEGLVEGPKSRVPYRDDGKGTPSLVLSAPFYGMNGDYFTVLVKQKKVMEQPEL